MTDITELAQSLKAAAENAIGAHERLAAYPYGEIIDISQHEGEQIDIDITDINEFHEEASPANILALVEALEKAQTKAVEQGHTACELFDEVTTLRQRISELEESNAQVIHSRDHYKRMSEEGLKQLAVSRTVTVKLLKDHVDDADLFGWGVVVVPLEALKEACADAGVTVEIADAGIKVEVE